MLIVLSLVQCLLGFAALALPMDRHHAQWLPCRSGPGLRLALRTAGTALLAAALACAVADRGCAGGFLLWLGLLTPSALAVTAALACGPGGAPRRPPGA